MENKLTNENIFIKNLTLIISVFVLIFVLSFKIYLIFSQPPGFDTGALSYIAKEINNGKLPYIDLFDHKPPLTYYSLALFFKLFGESIISTNVFSFFIGVILLISIFIVTKLMLSYKLAIISTAISSVFFITNIPAMEIPMIIFGLWGVYFYLSHLNKEKPILLLLSGIFIGFSIWFKQPGIIFFISILTHQIYLYHKKHELFKNILRNNILIILGIIVISIPLLSYFLYTIGFSKFFYSIITFNILFTGSSSKILVIGKLFLLIISMFGLLIPFIFIKQGKEKKLESFFINYFIIMLIFLVLSKEIFEQHLFQFIPFISIYVVYSFSYIKNKELNKILSVLIIIFFIYSSLTFLNEFIKNRSNSPETIIEQINLLIPKNSEVFSDNPIYYFLGNYENNYKLFFIAPSVVSVFDLTDFCKFSKMQDYLILTHRKKFLGEENLECIKENFQLEKKFDNIGESFVEIWAKS